MGSEAPKVVRIYTRGWCGHCFATRRLFDSLGVEIDEISLDRKPDLRRKISEQAGGWTTVPMIFVGDRFIGGYREVVTMYRRGELEALIAAE
jgi:glutaredoxin 3